MIVGLSQVVAHTFHMLVAISGRLNAVIALKRMNLVGYWTQVQDFMNGKRNY